MSQYMLKIALGKNNPYILIISNFVMNRCTPGRTEIMSITKEIRQLN